MADARSRHGQVLVRTAAWLLIFIAFPIFILVWMIPPDPSGRVSKFPLVAAGLGATLVLMFSSIQLHKIGTSPNIGSNEPAGRLHQFRVAVVAILAIPVGLLLMWLAMGFLDLMRGNK
ncbi:MAG: hypothetical protein M3R43_05220 [Acidobacteriota bacterium]|nr:hypothetical protein [Acidobacteriota bacterium]